MLSAPPAFSNPPDSNNHFPTASGRVRQAELRLLPITPADEALLRTHHTTRRAAQMVTIKNMVERLVHEADAHVLDAAAMRAFTSYQPDEVMRAVRAITEEDSLVPPTAAPKGSTPKASQPSRTSSRPLHSDSTSNSHAAATAAAAAEGAPEEVSVVALFVYLRRTLAQFAMDNHRRIEQLRLKSVAQDPCGGDSHHHHHHHHKDPHSTVPSPHASQTAKGAEAGDSEAAVALEVYQHTADYWHRMGNMVRELRTVWVYLDRWLHVLPSLLNEPAVAAAGAASRLQEVTADSIEQLAVEVTMRAQEEHPLLVDAAVEGFLLALQQDLEEIRPPTGQPPAVLTTAATTTAAAETESDCYAYKATSVAQQNRREALFFFIRYVHVTRRYAGSVEPRVVAAVREHYSHLAQRMWAATPPVYAADYFRFVSDSFAAEDARAEAYLIGEPTALLLHDAVKEALLGEVGRKIARRDFGRLMAEGQLTMLRRMWSFFHYIPASSNLMVEEYRRYITERGTALVHGLRKLTKPQHQGRASAATATTTATSEDPFQTVHALIVLIQDAEKAKSTAFPEQEKVFSVQLHEALETVFDYRPHQLCNQLAQCLDATLERIESGELPLYTTAELALKAKEEGQAAAKRRRTETEQQQEHEEQQQQMTATATATNVNEEEEESAIVAAMASAHRTTPPSAPATTLTAEEEARALEQKGGARLLDDIGLLFAFHPHHDYFEAYYWRDLTRRLLHPHRRVHVPAEEYFINVMKLVRGASEVSRYEGMLRDMRQCDGLTQEFKQWVVHAGNVPLTVVSPDNTTSVKSVASPTAAQEEAAPSASQPQDNEEEEEEEQPEKKKRKEKMHAEEQEEDERKVPLHTLHLDQLPPIEVRLQLLTSGYWRKIDLVHNEMWLPSSLQHMITCMEQFYFRKFQKRLLVWQHRLGSGTLRARLHRGTGPLLELTGTMTQCMALLLLDEGGADATMTVADLCGKLGVDLASEDVLTSLMCLCEPSFPLLLVDKAAAPTATSPTTTPTSSPVNKEPTVLAATDRLRVNDDFTPSTTTATMPYSFQLLNRMTQANASHQNSTVHGPTAATTDSSAAPDQDSLQLPSPRDGGGRGMTRNNASEVELRVDDEEDDAEEDEERGGGRPSGASAGSSHHHHHHHGSKQKESRLVAVQAILAKHFKKEGTVKHETLVSDMSALFPFEMNAAMLKGGIEKLIQKGYLERKGQDTYVYLP